MPIAGWLCESQWGWRSAYYLFGLLSLFLFLGFLLLYRNRPAESPFVSQREAAALVAANERHQQMDWQKRDKVPYAKMLTDSAVWACLMSGIGSGLAYWMFAQYGPIYMHAVRKG